jgi:pilus assembly protein CpaF
MEGPIVTMQDLFLFHRQGFDEKKRLRGYFCATGIRPKFTDKLYAAGINLPSELFDPEKSRHVI